MPSTQGSQLRDTIAEPLAAIRSLYDLATQPTSGDAEWGVREHFERLLAEPASRDEVPILTEDTTQYLPDNTLCRCRGMIRDTLNNELYVGAVQDHGKTWHTTSFCDSTPEELDECADTVLWDRKAFSLGDAPGQSAWSVALESANLGTQNGATENSASQGTEQDWQAEKARSEGTTPSRAVAAGREGRAFKVLMYGRDEGPKMNEMVEVVGVLSKSPGLAHAEDEDSAIDQLPRVHAVLIDKLIDGDRLPVITFKDSAQRQGQVMELRSAALDFLTAGLGGDRLAAEYMLLYLLSRAYSRSEDGAIGSFSLNLTNCTFAEDEASLHKNSGLSSTGSSVLALLTALVPRAVGLPLDVEKLNARSWVPVQDPETSLLGSAPLQLAAGTHVLLDESLLKPGQLTGLGLKNLEALKTLVESQKVEYDCNFYSIPMPADAPVLVVSGSQSLLKASLSAALPLQPGCSLRSPEEISAACTDMAVGSVRSYLALMRATACAIPRQASAFLEAQLVAARQEDCAFGAREMHTSLTLARLVALSHGRDELCEGSWDEMRRLEYARQQRVRAAK